MKWDTIDKTESPPPPHRDTHITFLPHNLVLKSPSSSIILYTHKAKNTSIQCKTVLCLPVLYVQYVYPLILLLNCAPLSTPKSNVIIINILKQNVCYHYNPPSPLLVNLKIKQFQIFYLTCLLQFYLLSFGLLLTVCGGQCQSNHFVLFQTEINICWMDPQRLSPTDLGDPFDFFLSSYHGDDILLLV